MRKTIDIEEGYSEWVIVRHFAKISRSKRGGMDLLCIARTQCLGIGGSFEDQAGQVEGQRECVREERGFGCVGEAKGRRPFELSARLDGIAALSIRLSADA